MALSSTIQSVHVSGDVDPVDVEIVATIASDAKEVGDAGIAARRVVIDAVAPRAALNAFVAACKATSVGGWPEGAIPLPVEKQK